MAFDFSPMDMEAEWPRLGLTLQDPGMKMGPDTCLTLQETMWLLSTTTALVLKGRSAGGMGREPH